MTSGISFLVLIGLRGVQPYAPLRVMRQLARVQEISPNDDMRRFAYDTPSGFAFNSEKIMKIWYESIISKLSEMVVEKNKGKVVPGYLSWFHDPTTFGDTPEGSIRKRRDQHIIRHLKKSWRRPKQPLHDKKYKSKEEKSQVRVARYGRRIEAFRGKISPVGERIT